jgi:hypothetical protein
VVEEMNIFASSPLLLLLLCAYIGLSGFFRLDSVLRLETSLENFL